MQTWRSRFLARSTIAEEERRCGAGGRTFSQAPPQPVALANACTVWTSIFAALLWDCLRVRGAGRAVVAPRSGIAPGENLLRILAPTLVPPLTCGVQRATVRPGAAISSIDLPGRSISADGRALPSFQGSARSISHRPWFPCHHAPGQVDASRHFGPPEVPPDTTELVRTREPGGGPEDESARRRDCHDKDSRRRLPGRAMWRR